MATIDSVLKNTDYSPLIDGIASYLLEENDPFKNAMAALILEMKLKNWNSGGLRQEKPSFFENSNEGKGDYIASTNPQMHPWAGLVFLRDLASIEGYNDPFDTVMARFYDEVAALPGAAPNAWANFNFAVNVFHELIDSYSFFAMYKDGLYAQRIQDYLGLYQRPGSFGTGLNIYSIIDGFPGGVAAEFWLQWDTGGAAPKTPLFWTLWDFENGNHHFINIRLDGWVPNIGPTPVAPDAGTIIPVVVDLFSLSDAPTNAAAIIAVLSGISTITDIWDLSLTGPGNSQVRFLRKATGAIYASPATPVDDIYLSTNFAGIYSTFNIASLGEPGTGEKETIKIDYRAIYSNDLNGRYFSIWDELDTQYVFWYDIEAIAPTVPGATLVQISITGNETPEEIQTLTDAAILAQGFLTLVSADNLCSGYIYINEGAVTDPTPDTADTIFGWSAITEMRSVGDNTLITDVDPWTYNDWILQNNNFRAVYDTAFNAEYYLSSIQGQDGNGDFIGDGIGGKYAHPANRPMFRINQYLIDLSLIAYNVPGSSFAITPNSLRLLDKAK